MELLFLFLIAYFLAPALAKSEGGEIENEKTLSLIIPVAWVLVPPVLLFVVATLLDSGTLFSERYLLPHALAFPLLLATLVSRMKSGKGLSLFLGIFLLLGLAGDFLKFFPKEDWRGAVSALKQVPDDTPVLFYSGLFESQSIKFLEEVRNREYLTAPLRYYGYERKVDLVPFKLGAEDQWQLWQGQLKMLRSAEKGALLIHEATTLEGDLAGEYFKRGVRAEGFFLESTASFDGLVLLRLSVNSNQDLKE